MIKLFLVNGTDITISRGDTGAVRINANATRADLHTPYTFGERDRAVFSIKDSAGTLKRQKAYPLVNNAFISVFTNQDTENVGAGGYTWDVRYVINPYYDKEVPGGPWTPYENLTFPLAEGTPCEHSGTMYYAKQAIQTAENWTASHWKEAWPPYSSLTFPVAAGTQCSHGGTYYTAKQAIQTSEEWTSSHWSFADHRVPIDGDQVITPNTPMGMNMLTVVGEI